ncbi:MAG: hypothetical protein P1V13_16830 [Rhizobiaceae bacterium]|nr:hypothetical protein [Rhizobiaceae bacterium]
MNTMIHRRAHISIMVEDAFGRLFSRIARFIKQRAQRHQDMRHIRELASMGDRDLRDMGIGRGDLYWASQLPINDRPTTGLNQIARKNQRA